MGRHNNIISCVVVNRLVTGSNMLEPIWNQYVHMGICHIFFVDLLFEVFDQVCTLDWCKLK